MLTVHDDNIEEVYNLINSCKEGITIDDIAKQYPPKDATAPYSVATLLADCRVKPVLRDNKLYCVVVEKSTNELGSVRDEKDKHISPD